MPRMAPDFPYTEKNFLRQLQLLALQYFLDNQTSDGLFLDRQRNFGPPLSGGWRSTAASGMGLIAIALASAAPYRLLTRGRAAERVGLTLRAALERLPHRAGVMPHFTDENGVPVGTDVCSTIDTAWLVAGGLWAATFLRDAGLMERARLLFDRIDWRFWTMPPASRAPGLIRHGQDRAGRLLPCAWDRLNGETISLYILAAGADECRAWPADGWSALRPFFATAAGLRFISADLGLFVFQYGLDLLDLEGWREPSGLSLAAEAAVATEANYRCCRAAGGRYETYRTYWGLSAGDGPGDKPNPDTYRCYSPSHPLDGTAHLTATIASVAHQPTLVLDNLLRACSERRLSPLGRYGFGSINLDRRWVGRDMVGIDAGASILALDNLLAEDRVRKTFHELPCVNIGLRRAGFLPIHIHASSRNAA